MKEKYKVDLRWTDGARLTDRTHTSDRGAALTAFRRLLDRLDLVGQDVAARLVVDGKSLYYSRFDREVGKGRIHPDAPICLDADRTTADRLASWVPPSPAHDSPGRVVVAPSAGEAAVADEVPIEDDAEALAGFLKGNGWTVTGRDGATVPTDTVALQVIDFIDRLYQD